jgi:hypothetical protein
MRGRERGIGDGAPLVARDGGGDDAADLGDEDAAGERAGARSRGQPAQCQGVVAGRGADGMGVDGEHGGQDSRVVVVMTETPAGVRSFPRRAARRAGTRATAVSARAHEPRQLEPSGARRPTLTATGPGNV